MAIVPNLGIPGGVDVKLDTPNRTAASAVAVQALLAAYPGETVVALDTGTWFRAWGPAANQWAIRYRR